MFASNIQECVEKYFSSLNPMTNRILVDAETVRRKNGGNWEQMSYEQQCGLIMDAFVKDKVGDRYSFYPQNKPDFESFPKLCVRSGEKYVVDEENQSKGSGNTWRDEHSGPFTWETQSQLNLSLVENSRKDPPLPRKPPPVDRLSSAKFYKVLPSKQSMPKKDAINIEPVTVNDDIGGSDDNRCLVNHLQTFGGGKKVRPAVVTDCSKPSPEQDTKRTKANIFTKNGVSDGSPSLPHVSAAEHTKKLEEEAAAPPPLPASVQNDEKQLCAGLNDFTLNLDLSPSKDSDIPKTGFDFLDDW